MKDIQLTKTEDNTSYDWNFNSFDVETVIGEQQIVNAVIHNIMLHNNELRQEIYWDKGCSVYDNLPTRNTPSSQKMLKELILSSVLETDGVRDATAEITVERDKIIIEELNITLDNGKEVRINGI